MSQHEVHVTAAFMIFICFKCCSLAEVHILVKCVVPAISWDQIKANIICLHIYYIVSDSEEEICLKTWSSCYCRFHDFYTRQMLFLSWNAGFGKICCPRIPFKLNRFKTHLLSYLSHFKWFWKRNLFETIKFTSLHTSCFLDASNAVPELKCTFC